MRAHSTDWYRCCRSMWAIWPLTCPVTVYRPESQTDCITQRTWICPWWIWSTITSNGTRYRCWRIRWAECFRISTLEFIRIDVICSFNWTHSNRCSRRTMHSFVITKICRIHFWSLIVRTASTTNRPAIPTTNWPSAGWKERAIRWQEMWCRIYWTVARSDPPIIRINSIIRATIDWNIFIFCTFRKIWHWPLDVASRHRIWRLRPARHRMANGSCMYTKWSMHWKSRIRISNGTLSMQRIIFIWHTPLWWRNMCRISFSSIARNDQSIFIRLKSNVFWEMWIPI